MPSKREVLVGMMFFASLATFLFLALVMAAQTFEFGKETKTIVIEFEEVSGVMSGTPVRLNGMNVGNVKEVIRNPETRRIDVVAEIGADVFLRETYQIEIQTGLFGGSFIYISDQAAASVAQIDMTEKLRGQALPSPFTQFSRMAGQFEDITHKTDAIAEQIRIMVEDINAGKGAVGMVLRDENFAKELHETLTTVRETLAVYKTVGEEVEKITAEARFGSGLLPKLLTDGEMSQSVRNAITDLQAMTNEARKALTEVNSIVTKINSEQGPLGYALSNPDGRRKLESIVDDLAATMPHVRNTMASIDSISYKIDTGVGTVGRILNDPELYDQLMQTLTIATRSLEDLRETSPITAFASLLFQAFQ